VCCYLDGQCFDPATSPNACAVTPEVEASISPEKRSDLANKGLALCGSDVDCAADQYCAAVNSLLCLGVGVCISRNDTCGEPAPATSLEFAQCGCDSVTYPDYYTACKAGVRVLTGRGACGYQPTGGAGGGPPGSNPDTGLAAVACGTAGTCPSGQTCCSITGHCYDPQEPALCAFPPPGTLWPCIYNADCPFSMFCYAEGCDGPGGCGIDGVKLNKCGVEFAPVCGCDGTTYTSEACAFQSKVRVDHDGTCN
jgi:hypothetical protein